MSRKSGGSGGFHEEPPELSDHQKEALERDLIRFERGREQDCPQEDTWQVERLPKFVDGEKHAKIFYEDPQDLELHEVPEFDPEKPTLTKKRETIHPEIPMTPYVATFMGSVALGSLINKLFRRKK